MCTRLTRGYVFRNGDLEIRAFAVHHGIWPQAFGYRIKTPDKTIVISGDCAPSPEVIEACNGCDVLLHEVYAMEELKSTRKDWPEYLKQFHTSTTELGEIAQKARPKVLVLYHQIMDGVTDAELVKEVKAGPETRVVSARDFDIF